MPLTLVIGPANSAKAGAVLGAFRTNLRRDPWLVVPTVADVGHYEAELTADGVARDGGRVATFRGLVREIARRSGYAARTVGSLQRERLVAAAIASAELDALAPAAASRGFLHAAVAFVAELERALVSPARLIAALRAWPAAPAAAHEIAAVYGSYARSLERLGRVDGDGFAWHALDALRERPGAWGTTPVFLYGFDDVTPVERDAIETLARVAGADVTVSLTYERGRMAFAGRATVAEELIAIADRVDTLPPLAEHYDEPARVVLHHLERRLFEVGGPEPLSAESGDPFAAEPGSARGEQAGDEPARVDPEDAVRGLVAGSERAGDEPARVDPGDAVRGLIAGGERAEIELIGAELLRLLTDPVAPVPGERIAVVLRNPARSAPLVEQVFGSYGIPFALSRQVPFAHTALGRGLLALARCALTPERASAGDLVAFLRTPGRLDRLELADRLESAIRREAIGDVDGARAAWESAPGGWPLRELDRLRGAAADGPAALYDALAREARALLAAPHRAQARVLDQAEEADARAVACLLEALKELGELAAAEPRRPPEDLDALLATLAELEVELGSQPRPGAVLVADPLAIRARRFDTVVVAGLQEGEFPRPAHPEPFLPDEQRRELAAASGLVLPPREDALADERYLFYASVARPTRRLILSWRDADEDGNPALPSFFLDDVRDLLSEMPPTHRPLAHVTWSAEAAPTTTERRRAQALAAPREVPPVIAPLGAEAQASLRQREVLSAGALENYARCPVRWFVERELDPERFSPDPEAIARGSMIHRVLERTLGRLEWPLDPAALPASEEIVREVVEAEAPGFTLGRGDAAQAAAAHEILADVLRLLAHEAHAGGAFHPAELELRFGMGGEEEGGLPALVLGDGDLRLRGVIDRVDLDAAGRALVRDFKSGRRSPSWPVARWTADDQLQVALYMVAVRELLRREPVGGVYQPLRGEDLRARGVIRDDVDAGDVVIGTDRRSREELEASLDEAAARACELAAALRGGALRPTPETCSGQGCAYPGICRVGDG